ncbi:flavodoxin family protein [Thermodesulfobacteriota bacterium]
MMKVLVAFYSETGNTEKLAGAIYESVEQAKKKDLMPIHEVQDLDNYDLIFCGFPVQASSVPGKVETFLKGVPGGKSLALFATHGSRRGGQLASAAFDYATSLASQTNFLGTFGCQGKVRGSIIEAVLKRPEHKAWAEEARSAAGHPDEPDLEDCKEFAMRMVVKARSQ